MGHKRNTQTEKRLVVGLFNITVYAIHWDKNCLHSCVLDFYLLGYLKFRQVHAETLFNFQMMDGTQSDDHVGILYQLKVKQK